MRRLLPLLAAVAAVFGLTACGEKKDATRPASTQRLDLMLDYFPNADHAGIYQALADGDFRRAGLDVKLRVPSDPSAPLKLVARPAGPLADLGVSNPGIASESQAPNAIARPAQGLSPLRWPMVLAGLYFAVTLGLFMRFLVGYRFSRRLLRRSENVADSRAADSLENLAAALSLSYPLPKLCFSDSVTVPLTVGWRQPAIIPPESQDNVIRVTAADRL